MSFAGHECRVRVDHVDQNFVILGRIDMNLLKQECKTKAGLKARRLKPVTGPSRNGVVTCPNSDQARLSS